MCGPHPYLSLNRAGADASGGILVLKPKTCLVSISAALMGSLGLSKDSLGRGRSHSLTRLETSGGLCGECKAIRCSNSAE